MPSSSLPILLSQRPRGDNFCFSYFSFLALPHYLYSKQHIRERWANSVKQ
uniref:Uncharacterized protein n=1 Tax=Rhizophora mucronata TaxID=61149 RepID=A0A2P2PGD3_RHIMU